ncbi:MAG: hypothetical protein WCJ81_04755 [bacterium]
MRPQYKDSEKREALTKKIVDTQLNLITILDTLEKKQLENIEITEEEINTHNQLVKEYDNLLIEAETLDAPQAYPERDMENGGKEKIKKAIDVDILQIQHDLSNLIDSRERQDKKNEDVPQEEIDHHNQLVAQYNELLQLSDQQEPVHE